MDEVNSQLVGYLLHDPDIVVEIAQIYEDKENMQRAKNRVDAAAIARLEIHERFLKNKASDLRQ